MRRGFQVRGRKAQSAAAHVTADDDALHSVRAPKRPGGTVHVTHGQPLPDVGRGNRHVVHDEHRDSLGGEIVFVGEMSEQRHVAESPVAEPEILPHHHRRDMQPLGQDPPDELIWAHSGEFQSEREHAHRVGAESGEQFGPAPVGAEERRVGARPDDLIRMPVESDHHDRQVPGAGDLASPCDDALVASVHAVKYADRGDALTPVGGNLGQAMPVVHDPRSSFARDHKPNHAQSRAAIRGRGDRADRHGSAPVRARPG